MTIDDAIDIEKNFSTTELKEYHSKLAEWLEELKVLRKKAKGDKWYQQGRADAIDEFCHWYFDMKNDAQINAVDDLIKRFNAEQLKENK